MIKSGIYVIANSVTGKMYVGSAVYIASRKATHLCHLRRGSHPNKKLQNAWSKHGESSFSFRTLLRCAKKDLVWYEQRAIDVFNSVNNGYNILSVAGSALGYKHTDEHKSKLKGNAHALGLKHTEEAKLRMSIASKGNQHGKGWKAPDEWRKNLSEKMKGKKQTPEHIEKRIAASVAAKKAKRLEKAGMV